MTEDQIEDLVKRVSKQTVLDTLVVLGVDASNVKSTLDMQADFKYLRESRQGKEEFISKSKWAVMGVFIAGTLGLLAKGFIAWVQAGGN